MPLNPVGENQKENAKTPNLPQRVIRIVNSYVNEAKEPQPTQSKVLLKYTPKDKRKANQKALIPVKKIVNTLVKSYTFRLRRIDQSMPKENLVIRTSLGNKRVVLRGSSSASLIEAPFSSTLPPRGLSSPKRRQKKDNKRRFAETHKQIKISYESGVLKGSFQGNIFQNLQVSNDGGVLKAYAMDDLVFTPEEQEMFSQDKQVQPQVSVFQRFGKSMNPKKETSKLERKRSGS